MHVHALGGHQVDNALAACAVAEAWGIPLSVMQAGIAAFRTEGSRMTEAQGLNGVRLIDDAYNANPRAMEVALSVLLAQPGKRIMVMADMLELGEDAEAYHAAFGRHAKAQGLESLYTVGQHSEAAAQAFGEGARHMASNKALIEALHPCCAEGTVMLFKGSNSMGLPSVVRALLPEDT